MQVYFCAALDGVVCDAQTCSCSGWIRAADKLAEAAAKAAKTPKSAKPSKTKQSAKSPKSPKSAQKSAAAAVETVAFPPPRLDALFLDAVATGKPRKPGTRSPQWADFPVSAWRTPDGVDLGFSTLCSQVRAALAEADEPVAIATADGGWRRPIGVFEFGDKLKQVAVRPRDKMPWRDFAELRELCLDVISDRRQPLLARLAEVAGIGAAVVDERALPTEIPGLSARSFLAWRGFLESRVATANASKLSAFAVEVAPLFARELGLSDDPSASLERLTEALSGDWRQHLVEHVAPVERAIGDALESYFGARLFALPVQRDVSLARAWAELFEGLAVGLRYLAALCAATGTSATPTLAVAAMALGEHFVVSTNGKLPGFALPPKAHGHAPRMADVDMTLASIC